uniref:Gustatory receptor n=1 Tax=Stomoxys calcitrans TaxID=35570 RepID=A0A454A0J4_STOCA
MDKEKLKYIVGLVFGIAYSLGLLVCMYSKARQRFYVSPLLMLWSTLVTIIVTIASVQQFYTDWQKKQMDLTSASQLYYYVNVVGVIINYNCQLMQVKVTKDFLNTVPFFSLIEYLKINGKALGSSVALALLKIIIFPLIIECNLLLRHYREEAKESPLKTLYTLYPVVISNFLPNCVFGIMVMCEHSIKALNMQLKALEEKANFYQNERQIALHKPYHRMQIFCNLSDLLEELSEKYSLICLKTLQYVDIHAVPLLAALLSNLLAITSGLFHQYSAIASVIINRQSYDIFDAVTNGVFLLISIMDMVLYGMIANYCMETIRETSLILKRIRLNNCDIRFRQSVDRFSLQIFVQQFKIQPMGLLEINISLMHDVLSAVTSFLLILIQSDLTLRFSLK